jgi:hypothetical protein
MSAERVLVETADGRRLELLVERESPRRADGPSPRGA